MEYRVNILHFAVNGCTRSTRALVEHKGIVLMQEIVERVKPFTNFYYLVKVRIKSSLTAQHVERAVRSRLSCTFDSHILECIIYKVVFVNLRVKHGYTYSVAAVNSRKVITCNMVAHELFLHLTVATFGVQHVEPVLCVVRAVLWSPHRKGLRRG